MLDVDDLNDLELNGVITYDACLCQDVMLIAPLMAILADNPGHSELMNHLGHSAEKY